MDPNIADRIDTPQLIQNLNNITTISTGAQHNLCIDSEDALWVFGNNAFNQLGLGEDYVMLNFMDKPMINPYFKKDVNIAECGSHHSLCINKNGKAFTFGFGESGQCGIGPEIASKRFKFVSVPFCINDDYDDMNNIEFEAGTCGGDQTILLSVSEQKLYAFGWNVVARTSYWQETKRKQYSPHLYTKDDMGIDDLCKIVNVKGGYDYTIIVCEYFDS